MAEKSLIRRIKDLILFVVRIPEKIKVKIYQAAGRGDIWFPDKAFQKWDYKIHSGRKLSFKNPVTFCEKLQWLKYYYRDPKLTDLVDKYEVRNYVSERIGKDYLTPVIGVYNSWDEINFSEFPDKFVIKCTHDSGSVVICTDKDNFDYESAKFKIETGLKYNHFYRSREWPYKNVKPRIICEEYLEGDNELGLVDYKFFMFSGEFKFVMLCTNRFKDGGMKISMYDKDWNRMPVSQIGEIDEERNIEKPDFFDELITASEKLSHNLPFVRVDFVESKGKIYFTELTFFDSGGRKPFQPEEYEIQFGEWIKLPTEIH